uniref:DUF269 domain-containing protein n=1 Tax=Hydrogenobacter sp. TaxID=2152829 RepID=A0A7C2ZJN3_9AQUI
MVIGESLGEVFLKEIVSQVRAYDTYGTWEKRSDEDLLKEFLKGENKKPLSLMGHCQIDPKAMLKIYAYFKALGATIEKLSGFITSVVINMDDEGNGTVLIYTGRLILVNKSIRNAHMFGFKSIEDMKSQGEKLIHKALHFLENHTEVARLS